MAACSVPSNLYFVRFVPMPGHSYLGHVCVQGALPHRSRFARSIRAAGYVFHFCG
jgi:hypothetical protein